MVVLSNPHEILSSRKSQKFKDLIERQDNILTKANGTPVTLHITNENVFSIQN
jgi:UDP-N-acetyl-D-mannosaminuronic acid transferase (WecB/TagA/CpsF family)